MSRLRCAVGCYLVGGMLGSSVRWAGWGREGERRRTVADRLIERVVLAFLRLAAFGNRS